jgi:glycosyltransferase involved in cell wall biosynthesis
LGLPADAFVVLHAGNMGYKQGLENVIECARLAADVAPGVCFALMGDGNQRGSLEALASGYQLPNLRFLPLQPDDAFAEALAAADLLLVNQRRSVVDMSLPSKLTSYFAAGRPVVAAVASQSESAREVEASSAGVVVPPDDPAELLRTLRMLIDQPAVCAGLGARGRRYAAVALAASSCLARYDDIVDAMLGRRPLARPLPARSARAASVRPAIGDQDTRVHGERRAA